MKKRLLLVREYHLSNQIVFSSFNHDSVSLLAEIAPEIPRAILYDTPLADPIAEAQTREATGLHPNFELLTKEFVQLAQNKGMFSALIQLTNTKIYKL